MQIEWIVLGLCAVGWAGTARLVYEKQSFGRLFGLLLMSVWLYISFMLVLFAANLPLEVLLFFGVLPVVCVAYGYRLYEHYRKREKLKNDDKIKREDAVAL